MSALIPVNVATVLADDHLTDNHNNNNIGYYVRKLTLMLYLDPKFPIFLETFMSVGAR